MVVPSRDLVNIFFSSFSNLQNTQQEHSLTQEMDIKIGITRSQSKALSVRIENDGLDSYFICFYFILLLFSLIL